MSKTLRYRLFKVGAMPDGLRDEIKKEQVLFLDEGIPVTVRRRGTAPGFRGGATGKFSGAIAITDRRIVASVSKTSMVDAAYNAKDAAAGNLSITEDGLHVTVDASVNPRCTGEIEMHFKAELTKQQIDQFPFRQMSFHFAPELVPKVFGVAG
jgi:hypothetical protein